MPSWDAKLQSLSTYTIRDEAFPTLIELISCYLSGNVDTPNSILKSFKDFLEDHSLYSVRQLKEELDLIFPNHTSNMASVPDPLYAPGVIENFMSLNGLQSKIAPENLLQALRFSIVELYKTVPQTSIIEFSPENYNFGLKNLSAFLAGISRIPISSTQDFDQGLLKVMNLSPGNPRSRDLAIELVLYDMKSLFEVTDSSPQGSIIRWNCAENCINAYIRSHSVNLSNTTFKSIITTWNYLIGELRNRDNTTYKSITKDTSLEDKKLSVDKLVEISEEFLNFFKQSDIIK